MRHAVVLVLVGALALGCASGGRETTVVREERVDPVTGEVIATQTTTRETEAKDYCDGVLSCTLDVTGTILAFPFRLIGGVFEVVF